MNIYHTTFENSQRGRATKTETSGTAAKVQEFISSHWSRSSDGIDMKSGQESSSERPITAWPRSEKETTAPGERLSESTAFLTKEHHEKKAFRKQEKIMSSANSSGSYLPLKESKALPGSIAPAPKLRHKAKLPDLLKGQPSRLSDWSGSSSSTDKENLAAMKSLQTAMKTGKIEKVVPPPILPEQEGRMAPPRGPLLLPASKPTAQKTKFGPNKAVEYIVASADILDETRREITSKFRPPFDQLNHSSFSFSKRASASSSTSSYSFCCLGESDADRKEKPAKTDHPERRLSGDGIDPWAQTIVQDCRLCRKPGVGGMKGLCNGCEMKFNRPQTMRSSSSSSSDVKPTPPLKDRRTLSLRRDKTNGQLVSHLDIPRQKEGLRLAKNGSPHKPTIVTPVPLRQELQRCVVESGDECDDKVTRWQRKAEHDRDRVQDQLERWSKLYGSGNGHAGDFAGEEDEEDDLTPLILSKDSGNSLKPTQRTTTFYGFWDELLQGHGKK